MTTNENHPSMLTQLTWTSPVTSRLLLEANAQLGPYFWWGSRQKNAFDSTLIPVQENGGAYSRHQLPRGQLVRAHRVHEHRPGIRVVRDRVALGEVRLPLPQQRLDVPDNFYNDSQLKYIFQDGVPNQVTVNADASHQQQQQSMVALYAQDRWTLRRLSLQGGLRFEHLSDYFPEQQMGPNSSCPPPWCSRPRTARSIRRT